MPVLVAMARSGETFVTRRDRYGLWLHLPPGARGAGPVNEAEVERAIADHGFVRIDREFATWIELDDFRQREAATFAPPVEIDAAALDVEDVRRMLTVAHRWAAEGRVGQSRRLLVKLLRVPAARRDDDLNLQLAMALEALEDAALVVPLREQPTDERKVAARNRWLNVVAAA